MLKTIKENEFFQTIKDTIDDNIHSIMGNKRINIPLPVVFENQEDMKHSQELKDLVKMADLAYDTPNIGKESLNGWDVVIEHKDESTGLKALMFKNADGKNVISFAGTQNGKDILNDFTQLFGISEQFESALSWAKEVIKKYKLEKTIFTGHSQGGAEAAYCALNLGLSAKTFNPAGLSSITKLKINKTKRKLAKIDAYIYATDMLNIAQLSTYLKPWGKLLNIAPDGKIHYLGCIPSKTNLHGMKGFIDYFGI